MAHEIRKSALLRALPISIGIISVLSMSACGTSTNPAKNYQDVIQKNDVPAGQETKTTPRLLVGSDFYTITADDAAYQRDLVFREGDQNSHNLTVKFAIPDVKYSLAITSPQGATITQSTQSPDVWVLSYPLPSVVLSEDENGYRPIDLQLQLQILPGTSAASAAVLNKIDLSPMIGGDILHGKGGPKITAVAGIDTPMNEGESRAITVDVVDPSSGDKVAPTLHAYAGDIDNQSIYADGSVYVRNGDAGAKPQSLGNNTWRFSLEIDTKDIKLDHKKARAIDTSGGAKGVNLQIAFKVQSRSGSSNVVTHEAVLLDIPAPTPTPTPKPKPHTAAHATPKPSPKPSPTPKTGDQS